MDGKPWIVLIILGVFLRPAPSGAAGREPARETLRDLEGVYVMVDRLAPVLGRRGLSMNGLREEVEGRLRGAGIKVLSRAEWERSEDKPMLYVNVSVVKGPFGSYVYSMSVQFFQMVLLVRNPSVRRLSMTWRTKGWLGSVNTGKLAGTVQKGIDGFVDRFIRDYQAVNPDLARARNRAPVSRAVSD